MNTNFNLRLDDELKAQSFGLIESFGLTPSQFMRLVLKQVADDMIHNLAEMARG